MEVVPGLAAATAATITTEQQLSALGSIISTAATTNKIAEKRPWISVIRNTILDAPRHQIQLEG